GGVVGHFGVLVPLALIGLVATRRDWRRLWVFYAVIAAYASSVVVFYVFARYRFPLAPMLMLFAAAGIGKGLKALAARRRASPADSPAEPARARKSIRPLRERRPD